MIGLGTVVNCAAILLGCAVGLILKGSVTTNGWFLTRNSV